MKKIFFAIAMVTATFVQLSTAQAFSEKDLQKKLRGLRAAYGWNCTGSACKEVYVEQIAAMDEVIQYVDEEIPAGQPISGNTGNLARSAAGAICGFQITNEDIDWVTRMVIMENRTLLRLEKLQRKAGSANPRKCRRKVE